MTSINNLNAWLFARAMDLDSATPGLAGLLFRCSNERRHVIAAYLSMQRPHFSFVNDAALGCFLMHAGHREILQATFNTVPEGLRGALRRAGARSHPRRFYPYVHALLSSESRTETKALIPLLKRVTPSSLATARALPDDLRSAALVRVLGSAENARDVAGLVALLSEADVDRVAMCRALAATESMQNVIEFAGKWSFRAKLPGHPVPRADFYIPVEHAGELKRLAIGYRNCLRNLLANALDGRAAFAVVKHNDEEAIVHLIHHRGQWALHEVCGPDNRLPDSALYEVATRYLHAQGIQKRSRSRSADSKWMPLRRLAGREAHQIEIDEVLLG